MEVDSEGAKESATAAEAAAKKQEEAAVAAVAGVVEAALPEVEVYLSTLALTTLLRHKANADAMAVAPKLLERAVSFNRRWVGSLGGWRLPLVVRIVCVACAEVPFGICATALGSVNRGS